MRKCRGFDLSLYFLLNLPSEDPIALAQAAIAGGVTTIQLRGKDAGAAELLAVAEALLPLTRASGVALLINDRLDVAMAAGADGVHVGKDDLPVEAARALAPAMIVGASCYGSLTRAQEMKAAGADYLAFGAMFASPTKPQAPLIQLQVLTEARGLGLPLVAIGGITASHVDALCRAGADGVAVISAIQAAFDPSIAAKQLIEALQRARIA